ncbi:MAG: hypothetical protein KKA54_15645 [Proteobacteria bacterium]|nr:hypothetical protein [Pseudomonadota bacterium]MBU0967805.1 hypothetical protein [Pseudomonadota bacterium]
MDYRVIALGVFLLIYGLVECLIGKAFVPAFPFLPDEGFFSKTKNKEAFWVLVIFKVLLGIILILGPIYKGLFQGTP